MELSLGVLSFLINIVSWVTGFGTLVVIIIFWFTRKVQFPAKLGVAMRFLLFTLLDLFLFFLIRFIIGGGTYSGSIVNALVSAILSVLIMFIRTERGLAWFKSVLTGQAGIS